jgi:ribonuclease HIII
LVSLKFFAPRAEAERLVRDVLLSEGLARDVEVNRGFGRKYICRHGGRHWSVTLYFRKNGYSSCLVADNAPGPAMGRLESLAGSAGDQAGAGLPKAALAPSPSRPAAAPAGRARRPGSGANGSGANGSGAGGSGLGESGPGVNCPGGSGPGADDLGPAGRGELYGLVSEAASAMGEALKLLSGVRGGPGRAAGAPAARRLPNPDGAPFGFRPGDEPEPRALAAGLGQIAPLGMAAGDLENAFMGLGSGPGQAAPQPRPRRRGPAAGPRAKSIDVPPVRIGADESGKGDYFGPLVTAAAYVDAGLEAALLAMGVQDSKAVSDDGNRRLAAGIKDLLGPARHRVMVLAPPEYNAAYGLQPNLNLLLASRHAATIGALLGQAGFVIVDQFAREALLVEALAAAGHRPELFQTPKGERDAAVAAASILARAAFIDWLGAESGRLGLPLPKGAGGQVDAAARRILKTMGPEALGRVAKLHFRNSRKAGLVV